MEGGMPIPGIQFGGCCCVLQAWNAACSGACLQAAHAAWHPAAACCGVLCSRGTASAPACAVSRIRHRLLGSCRQCGSVRTPHRQ